MVTAPTTIDLSSYRAGVNSGHADALEQLRPMVTDALGDLRYARTRRNASHREDPARRTWSAIADRHAGHLAGLLAVCRALKGAHRS